MSRLDETHDPARTSWVESADGHPDFPIQNLPHGVFSRPGEAPRGGVAIGDLILDMASATAAGLFAGETLKAAQAASGETLNAWLALSPDERRALRRRLSLLLSDARHAQAVRPHLAASSGSRLHLPARIGDYTDFYAGIHHAMNVGRLFRPDNPLLPNYKHVPIGYHGRASSVVASGHPVRRPVGQTLAAGAETPTHGPSRRLDIELELGVWIGQGCDLGDTLPIHEAGDHIAGLCLLNDWSARDLQAWEYQPLGPFLAKNFLTTVSPWIITAEALEPFRIAQPPRPEGDPRPLPYLWSDTDQSRGAFALELESAILTRQMRDAGETPFVLGRGPATNLYWTLAQLVTHHASNGCNLNPGDLLGTGTISSPDDSCCGSLLELTRGGQTPLRLPNGETRTFLESGDEIILTARARSPARISIGFGPCSGRIA
ncbi:Fumarylacetoacetate (FAA) hydrolase family protein [compost metagenome]